MRLLALLAITAVGCHHGQLDSMPLSWRGVDTAPQPSAAVSTAFQATPFRFGLRDVRVDPTAIGVQEDQDNNVVRTGDNVAQYCSLRLGELLANAGARMNETPVAALDTELLEYKVVEGGTYTGVVNLRAIVHNGNHQPWNKVYTGKSKRVGRSGSADNYNEALSNALADAEEQMVTDDEFAVALTGGAIPLPESGVHVNVEHHIDINIGH